MGILSYGYKAIKSIKPTKMSKGTKLIKKEQAEVSKKISKASKETPKLKTEFKEMGNKTKSDMTKSLLKHNKKRKGMMGGGMMGRQMYKKGGKSFPDLTGDGKVTKKDILKGRGVPGFKDGSKKAVRPPKPSDSGTGKGMKSKRAVVPSPFAQHRKFAGKKP
jgi:hypothetical protein